MAIIELINKIWDFIKSITARNKKKDECLCKKKPSPPTLILLRNYFNANDRRNLANWVEQEGFRLTKNTKGELVIIERQAFFLWKSVKRGSVRGKKRLKIAKSLEQIFQFRS